MELAHSRMTAARVITHLDALNPHRNTVLPMAEEGGGIPIWVPNDFVPDGATAEGVPSTVRADTCRGRCAPPDGERRIPSETPLFHPVDGRGTIPQPTHQPVPVGSEGGTRERTKLQQLLLGELTLPSTELGRPPRRGTGTVGAHRAPHDRDFVRMIEKFAAKQPFQQTSIPFSQLLCDCTSHEDSYHSHYH